MSRFLTDARTGWLDARLMVTMPGRVRALRFVAVLLFGQRLSYLAPALVNVASAAQGSYVSTAANLVMLGVAVGWNGLLAVMVWRRGWFTPGAVAVDVAFTCCLIVVANVNLHEGHELSGSNWAAKFALASAALIGAALPLRAVFPVLALPIAAAGISAWTQIGEPPWGESSFVNYVNSSIWFALLLHFMRRFLCSQAQAVDDAVTNRVAVETSQAADRARYAERLSHYGALHDTVLATLTALARGGLDHRTEQVRQRCAREAEYIRRLVAEDRSESVTTMGDRLAEVAAGVEGLGLRVKALIDQVPPHLPRHVVDAVGDAAREALNNVARHARVDAAWLTTIWSDGRLAVRIVDRGVGFDETVTPPGFGLESSVRGRMAAVGGAATVFSLPGEGTSVELFWPAEAH